MGEETTTGPASVADLTDRLRSGGYLADRGLATAVYVAMTLGRTSLVTEGAPEVLSRSGLDLVCR